MIIGSVRSIKQASSKHGHLPEKAILKCEASYSASFSVPVGAPLQPLHSSGDKAQAAELPQVLSPIPGQLSNQGLDTGKMFNAATEPHLTNVVRLPDASVTSDGVAQDVASLGQIGAGGLEFHNWFGSPTVRRIHRLCCVLIKV